MKHKQKIGALLIIALLTSSSFGTWVEAKGTKGGGRATTTGGAKSRSTTGGRGSSSVKSFNRSNPIQNRQKSSIHTPSKTYKNNSSFKNTSKISNATNRMSLGFYQNPALGWRSPSDYLFNPYRNPSRFYNYYFYWWLLHDTTDHQVAKNEGIDLKKIQNPQQETYWIKVKDKNGKEQALLVTKAQYDQINKGDHLSLVNQVLTKNNKVLEK